MDEYVRITRARFPAPRFIADELLAALDDLYPSVESNVCVLRGNIRPTKERDCKLVLANNRP